MAKKLKTKVLFPIGAKLVIIISILFILSLGAVIALVSVISTQDVKQTAEYNNFTINRRAGSHAESTFSFIQASVVMYLKLTDRILSDDMERDFFSHNRSIAGIKTGNRIIVNETYLLSNDLEQDAITSYLESSSVNAVSGRMIFANAAPVLHQPLLLVCFIRQTLTGGSEIVKVVFSPDELSETFGTGTNTSFIVTDTGELLLHPDNDLVMTGENMSYLPIVDMLQKERSTGMQVSYTDEKGESFFGAYYLLPGTDATVITTIPYAIVFEAVRSVTMQNIFLAGIVMFLSIIFIWFFSKTISTPVRILADAALQIEKGDFNVDLKPQHSDEIGLLTESFGRMTSALNIFGRFVNKTIALRAISGDIKPGGLPRHATIFFSDIRGFTEKSENFTKEFGDEASNRIVRWLNEYFTEMIDCVEKTGGVVDKFIGDAVMAHWGTASSAGSPEKDAFNAVNASIMMRCALHKLNEKRKKNDVGNPEIRIGCGLNTGIVTAGQLGSLQRMEYTVIGDPVNLASRVEALNKPLGTDILVAEDTWVLIKDKFITEEMPPVTVKGKKKPVRLFAVVNLKGADGPQTLAEARKMLGIEAPDISKVNINAEEKKYKIKGS